MDMISAGQFALVYNAFSFTIAVMGAATIFFFLARSQVAPAYKTALSITGLVTLIACYHYVRIFNSWDAAYSVKDSIVQATGVHFNDAYRYVDWLLTVPLLMVELILVMGLSAKETFSKSVRLGGLAALMVGLGYPGEIATSLGVRWIWWGLAMVPFAIIVFELFFGLSKSIKTQPASVRGAINAARWLTIASWSFYPVVFLFPNIGISGGTATTAVQVGYTAADIIAKAVFGLLIYAIAAGKSAELRAQDAHEAASPALA